MNGITSAMTISFRTMTIIISIFLSLMMSACVPQTPQAQTQAPTLEPQSTSFPNVSLPDSQVRQLKSSATGRNYDLYVLLPTDYAQNQKKYPILYLLDGQWDFQMLDSI